MPIVSFVYFFNDNNSKVPIAIFFYWVLIFLERFSMEIEIKTFHLTEDSPINSTIDISVPFDTKFSTIKVIGDGFNSYFQLDQKKAQIKLIKELDLENSDLCIQNQHCCDRSLVCKFIFLVRYFHTKSLSTLTFKLNIFVDDVNDWSPTFKEKQFIIEFHEGPKSIGEKRQLPIATDYDFSERNRFIKYKLQSNFDFKDQFQLLIDSNQQSPSLLLLNALDCETKNHFLIDLIATDNGGKDGRILLYIRVLDVNEFAPEFLRDTPNSLSIYESTLKNTIITKFNATDRDSYPNNVVTFSIEPSSQISVSNIFQIHPINGELRLISNLDYERVKRYSLIIIASDNASKSERKSSSISINILVLDVNDNAPELKFEVNNNRAVVKENQPVSSPVTILKITDRDMNQNGEVTCQLQKGEHNFFLHRILEKFYQIESNRVFDREDKDKYLVIITCFDHGKPSLTTTSELTVIIEDENDQAPRFVKPNFRFKIKENTIPQSVVVDMSNGIAKIDVQDPDQIGQLSFYIDRRDFLNFSSSIDISSKTGVLYSLNSLDRESVSELKVKVCCNDTIHVTCTDVYIEIEDENDNAPSLDDDIFRLNIEENSIHYNKPIIVFQPRDLDPTNAGFKYVFDHNVNEDVKKYFQLDNDKLLLKKPLDREDIASFQFIIQIFDNHPTSDVRLQTTAKVFITVLDQNDNLPRFIFPNLSNYSVNISCHEPFGHSVAKVIAVDPDHGENGTISFELVKVLPQKDLNLFHIDSTTGEIFINSPLISEQFCKFNFILMISAKDLGDDKLESTIYRKYFSRTFAKLQICLLDIPRSYSAKMTFMTPRLILTVILSCSTLFLICLLVAWAFIIFCHRNRHVQEKQEENYYSLNLLNNNVTLDTTFNQSEHCPSDAVAYIRREDMDKIETLSEYNRSFRPVSCCSVVNTNMGTYTLREVPVQVENDSKVKMNLVALSTVQIQPTTPSTSYNASIKSPSKQQNARSTVVDYEPLFIVNGHTLCVPKKTESQSETHYSSLKPQTSVVKFSIESTRVDSENDNDTYV